MNYFRVIKNVDIIIHNVPQFLLSLEFQEKYEAHFDKSTSPPLNLKSQAPFYHQSCYDATWILAKALDHTIRGIPAYASYWVFIASLI